jgi:hypothetical protein
MRIRPISGLTNTMREVGATVTDTNGCPPVNVSGTGIFPETQVVVDGSLSSQYISAILMAAACNDKAVQIKLKDANIDARGYIDITIAIMQRFGAAVKEDTLGQWEVETTGYQALEYHVEPDASAIISGGEPGPHPLQGIGPGFFPEVFDTKLIDGAIRITKEEAFAEAQNIAKIEGILVGISTGASLAAVRKQLETIDGDKIILTMNYDTGERYLSIDGLFKS